MGSRGHMCIWEKGSQECIKKIKERITREGLHTQKLMKQCYNPSRIQETEHFFKKNFFIHLLNTSEVVGFCNYYELYSNAWINLTVQKALRYVDFETFEYMPKNDIDVSYSCSI